MIDGRGRRNDEIWALDHYFKKTSKPKYESPPLNQLITSAQASYSTRFDILPGTPFW
jgi:hypothetical protein